MMRSKNRFPKRGDRVAALGHSGAFIVYSIDSSIHTVELKQIGEEFALTTIPWEALTFLDELDAPTPP
jgi:hypothetical protein